MMIDDTVILSTLREKMAAKLRALDDYCEANGMCLNQLKTKLMVLNGNHLDKDSFLMKNIVVKNCDSYCYLGAIFTSDGKTSTSLKEHLRTKNKDLNKLIVFLAENYDAPFLVKRKVIESWLNTSLRDVEILYIRAVRPLLGVRATTSNDLCLVEAGLSPVVGIIRNRQKIFLRNC